MILLPNQSNMFIIYFRS